MFYSQLDTRKHDVLVFRAAMTTACFGLLRSEEITKTSCAHQSPAIVLKDRDLTCATICGVKGLILRFDVSKTDPFRRAVNFYIDASCNVLCPLDAMENCFLIRYRQQRSNEDDGGFVESSGKALPYKLFTGAVKGLVANAGLSPQMYSCQSLRISRATALERKGVPYHIIQAFGRWSSDSYMMYLRLDEQDILRMVSIMSHS